MMKALLVADDPVSVNLVFENHTQCGYEVIHYRSALKALDNMEEIQPQLLFINASDFPRHWRVLTQFFKHQSVCGARVILLVNTPSSSLSARQVAQAGVHSLIDYTLSPEEGRKALCGVLTPSACAGSVDVGHAHTCQADFVFTNPCSGSIVTGTVREVSEEGVDFIPDFPASVNNLQEQDVLEHCALKVAHDILGVRCSFHSSDGRILLRFIDPDASLVHAVRSVTGTT